MTQRNGLKPDSAMNLLKFNSLSKVDSINRPEILYIFPPSTARKDSVGAVLRGELRPERYLFYGLDYVQSKGIRIAHNIRDVSLFSNVIGQSYRYIHSTLDTYGGNLEWILPVWKELTRVDVLVVFSERALLPLLFLQRIGLRPRKPTLFISVGLPEKLAQFKDQSGLRKTLDELRQVSRIIPLSKPEAELLNDKYGLGSNVEFVPAGVDTKYFNLIDTVADVDVLSIGGDYFRDFVTLLASARRLPEIKFRVITWKHIADKFQDVPTNVNVLTDIPMMEIRGYISRSHLLALPVMDNTYSGATTVMLQAMAMGKTVIANESGANKAGYGFKSEENCIFTPPQDVDALVRAIRRIYGNSELRGKIGKAARQYVEAHLDLNSFHKKLFNIIIEICPALRALVQERAK